MANPELGAKQICPACSTKFYDLNKRPAHCPKCATEFDPEEAIRNRRVRARAPLPDDDEVEAKPAVVAESEDGFEAEPEDAPEIDQPSPEDLLVADEDEDEGPTPPDEALGVDFAEDEDLEDADDDEVPFLEDDDDDDFSEDEIDGLPGEGDADD